MAYSYQDNRPPRVSHAMYKRAALAGALIFLLTAASVATAALLRVQKTVDIIRNNGHVATFKPQTITKAQAGKPQTILLVGSDKRFGERNSDARSDTMMLLRLDPHQQATAALSIPRDLLAQIPGHGQAKINSAYQFGGLDLVTQTLKNLLNIKINHAIEVNFSGFRHAVDYIGCVYVDVDRRYYHSNDGLPPSAQYAEIDIQPGYQQLCGQKALDYVRFRHADSDFVRSARQQDFLRQAKDQVGTSGLISDLDPLTRIFARATETDSDLQSVKGILRLIKLAAFSTGHPLREIPFPGTPVSSPAVRTTTATGTYGSAPVGGLGDYVTASPGDVAETADEFLHAKASDKPPSTGGSGKLSAAGQRQKRRNRGKSKTQWGMYGLAEARKRGEDLVAPVLAKHDIGFPMYFPSALTTSGIYPPPAPASKSPNPRIYTIRDRAGKKHKAYRIVVTENQLEGQYYGIQGTDWKTPPILKGSNEVHRMAGRDYRFYYDGRRLRAVSWRTPRAVYWVSNTLSLKLSNKQMSGLARSLTRPGA